MSQDQSTEKFVIIGGGTAAVQGAKAIRKRNAQASITLVCQENYLPYNRPALSAAVSQHTPMEKLQIETAEYYQNQEIQVLTGVKALSIDSCKSTVSLSNGTTLHYTGLLLATGATPFNPITRLHGTIPVYVLRTFDDALLLAKEAKGKRVVVAGGGILGLEAAASLHEIGAQVTIVEFAPRIMPLQTDEVCSEKLAQQLSKMGMNLLCSSSVSHTTAGGVVLADGTELAADLVLASMGVRSEVSLAVALGLELSRGIVVDQNMKTSCPGIWAAGDCAEYSGRVQALATTAYAMGAAAGASMAGDDSVLFQPNIPATMFQLGDFSMFSAGTVNAEEGESLVYCDPHKHLYRKLFFEDQTLQGAIFYGPNSGVKSLALLAKKAGVNDALELLKL